MKGIKLGKAGLFGLALTVGLVSRASCGPNDSNWVQLFRAGDTALSDWTPKIQGQSLGVNLHNTFRYAVSNDAAHTPMLEVIDTTAISSSYGYGHLFYKQPFSD